MFTMTDEGVFGDEAWGVLLPGGGVYREVLWRPFNEKRGRVYLLAGDPFRPEVSTEDLDCVLSVIASAPHHLFIAVTTWPELALKRLYGPADDGACRLLGEGDSLGNLWFLVRMTDQTEVEARMPAVITLKNCWLADGVHWPVVGVLAAPLHGAVDPWRLGLPEVDGFSGIDWLVCGGDGGEGGRTDREWVRRLRDQAEERNVPFLFTGWGAGAGRLLDGRTWDETPPLPKERNRLHTLDNCRSNCRREFCRAA